MGVISITFSEALAFILFLLLLEGLVGLDESLHQHVRDVYIQILLEIQKHLPESLLAQLNLDMNTSLLNQRFPFSGLRVVVAHHPFKESFSY